MAAYYHVIRVTKSQGQRAKYHLAQMVDSWGSGCLELVLLPEETFYNASVAHRRAQELNEMLTAALAKEKR